MEMRWLLLMACFFTSIVAREELPQDELIFSSCVLPGWSCKNKTAGLSSTIDSVTYKCQSTVTGGEQRQRYTPNGFYQYYTEPVVTIIQNFTLDLSKWDNLPISKVVVQDCGVLRLKMHTIQQSKIDTLVVENTTKLLLVAKKGDSTNHPQCLHFRKIDYVPVVPKGFISHSATKKIEFTDMYIGIIEKGAINTQSNLELFEWNQIRTETAKELGISVTLDDFGQFFINQSTFHNLRPLSIFAKGGQASIKNSNFFIMQEAAIRMVVQSFNFTGNQVGDHSSMYIASPDVTFQQNTFDEFSPEKLIAWTWNTGSDDPEQVSFTFMENTLYFKKRPDSPVRGPSCILDVNFVERKANCTELANPGSKVFDLPDKNWSVLNLLVCRNKPTDPFEVPAAWRPLNQVKNVCSNELLPRILSH